MGEKQRSESGNDCDLGNVGMQSGQRVQTPDQTNKQTNKQTRINQIWLFKQRFGPIVNGRETTLRTRR